jgi:hypothetical protein
MQFLAVNLVPGSLTGTFYFILLTLVVVVIAPSRHSTQVSYPGATGCTWPIWSNNQELQWYKLSMWPWNEVLGLNHSMKRLCCHHVTFVEFSDTAGIQSRCSRRKVPTSEFSQTLWTGIKMKILEHRGHLSIFFKNLHPNSLAPF